MNEPVDKLEHEMRKGEEARLLLENPTLRHACAEIEQKLTEAWKASAADDEKGRERVFRVLLGLQAFRRELAIVLENGAMAEHRLQQLKKGL
jgi:hypothetical protein